MREIHFDQSHLIVMSYHPGVVAELADAEVQVGFIREIAISPIAEIYHHFLV